MRGMARIGKLGAVGGTCSYKKTALIVCCINIVVALYVLRVLYSSLYIYSHNDPQPAVVKYTPEQISRMEESIRIRKAAEPVELVRVLKKVRKEFLGDEVAVELPLPLKKRMGNEILQRLRSLNMNANISQQREAVEIWREEKLKEVKQLTTEKRGQNSTITQKEAGILVRALESGWAVLSEDMGLWIPTEITHEEHNDRPENEEETDADVLPGTAPLQECHAELHTDYDGAAVRWGLTFHKESAADCCQACMDQARNARPGQMRCNVWVYCPVEEGCYSPDIYEHRHQECWLKYAKEPKVNFKDKYPEEYRSSHPTAPVIVPWVSGVINW